MSDSQHPPGEHANPKGALTITLIFLALVIVGWLYMYSILLSRGETL